MNIRDLVAIDVHTHAEVSCRQPVDEVWKQYEDAASKADEREINTRRAKRSDREAKLFKRHGSRNRQVIAGTLWSG